MSAAIHNLASQRVQQHYVPGSRFRNVKVAIVLRQLVTHRLSFPAYVLAYRYKDELYRVVICGQHSGLIIGRSPKSLLKIAAVVLAAVLAVLLVFGLIALAN